jgi:outer membrane protein
MKLTSPLGHFLVGLCLGVAAAGGTAVAAVTTNNVQPMTLNDCIATALLNNRALQIERLNPEIMRGTLSSSYGWYDPIFLGDVRKETDVDTGGFDPANFSADAIYEADSTIANGSITGFLPSGMSYNLYGTYANAVGTRNSLDFDSYRMFIGALVRQPLLKNLWIDQGRLAIKINKENLRFSELGVRYVAMDVINLVQQAYYELAYAYEAHRIQNELVNQRRKTYEGMRRQFEEGMAAQPDVQLAQAQLATAMATLNLTLTSRALAENMLRTAMGDSFTNQLTTRWMPADHIFLMPTEFELGPSWTRGIKNRPDLAQLRVNVEKADITVGFWRNQLFPALDLIGGYGRRGSSTAQDVPPFTAEASMSDAFSQIRRGEAPRDMVGIALTFPLSAQAERGSFKASKHLRAQAEIFVKQQEELVMREISDALHTAQTSYDRAIAAREAAGFARQAFEAEERRLAGGTSTMFFVLQLQNDLVTAQVAEARARADYNKALAQWHFAEGTSLMRRNVILDIE